jgi:hypothetical protein
VSRGLPGHGIPAAKNKKKLMKNADFLKIGFVKILLEIKQSLFGVPVFQTSVPAPRGITLLL